MSTTQLDVALDRAADAVADLDQAQRTIDALSPSASAATIKQVRHDWQAAKKIADDAIARADRIRAGNASRKLYATPRGMRAETTYRPGGPSYFRDLLTAGKGDHTALERLHRHGDEMRVEYRDVDAAVDAIEFVVPQYLQADWIPKARAGRPFVDTLLTMPLPATGLTFVLPRVNTAPTVAVQAAEEGAVSETDFDADSVTVPVVTIAGQNDVSQQAFDRSDPAIDQVIFQELRAHYLETCESQALSGIGSAGQMLGVRAVGSINTETYTSGTPLASELVPKLYEAISKIATARKAQPDLLVLHPRRAAWLAAGMSTSHPLFQLGSLFGAAGQQDAGFVTAFGGLRVIISAMVGTTYRSGTNEDEALLVKSDDLYFAEGPLQARVHQSVLSGTLQVRLQLFAYAALASARYPAGICKVSGTGFATPSFS